MVNRYPGQRPSREIPIGGDAHDHAQLSTGDEYWVPDRLSSEPLCSILDGVRSLSHS